MQLEYRHPNIFIFKRDQNNNRQIERIPLEDFRPYFFVPKDSEVQARTPIMKVEPANKKSIFGEELLKITVETPADVPSLKNYFLKTYEADIRFHNRYLLDKIKEIPTENLRKFYFDIETEDFPDIARSDKVINCICVYDNYTDKYYTFVLSKKVNFKTPIDSEVRFFDTEQDLLSAFIEFVRTMDPDMFIAHNGDRFDYPVLIGRMMNLSLNFSRMSTIGVVKRDNWKGEWRCKMGGRILFDFLGTKTAYGTKGGIRGLLEGRDLNLNGKIIRIKRWSLASLAKLIGMEKGKLKEVKDVEDLVRYNRLDVEIMLKLDRYFNVTEYYHNLQKLIGCNYEDTFFNTNLIDNFLLRRYSYVAFPTKEHNKVDSDTTIQGAFVDEPITGLYEKIYVVDQTSLYPSVIVSGNLSPETKDPNGDINFGNGVKFRGDKLGIIPDAVEFLLDIRLKYKKLSKEEKDPYKSQMYDLLSNGYKTLLVSFYGSLLYKNFRLYEYSVAETIPYAGRDIKQWVKKIVEDNGYKVIAGDTDSSFLYSEHPKISIEELVRTINKSFDEYANTKGIKKHILNIELDKIYSPLLMSDKKKRYVGYMLKGESKTYKATGWESVRKDTPKLTEDLQETIFKMILDGKKKKDVEDFVEKLKGEIKSGKVPLGLISIPKGFGKKTKDYKVDTPHVRAMEYSNKNLGTRFDQYSEISILYVKGVPEGKPYTDVVCIDEDTENILNGFAIDYDLMMEKIINVKVERIFEMLKWQDTVQKSLLEF